MALKFNVDKYTNASKNADFFSDFTSSFSIHPGTNDLARIRNDQAVVQSVRNLLLTDPGERFFRPLIGTNLKRFLFEDISPITALQIKMVIEDTLTNFETRIRLVETIVEPDDIQNGYNIRLKFYIINNTSPTEINLFLDRIR